MACSLSPIFADDFAIRTYALPMSANPARLARPTSTAFLHCKEEANMSRGDVGWGWMLRSPSSLAHTTKDVSLVL